MLQKIVRRGREFHPLMSFEPAWVVEPNQPSTDRLDQIQPPRLYRKINIVYSHYIFCCGTQLVATGCFGLFGHFFFIFLILIKQNLLISLTRTCLVVLLFICIFIRIMSGLFIFNNINLIILPNFRRHFDLFCDRNL